MRLVGMYIQQLKCCMDCNTSAQLQEMACAYEEQQQKTREKEEEVGCRYDLSGRNTLVAAVLRCSSFCSNHLLKHPF